MGVGTMMAPDAWNLQARVPRAARHIESLDRTQTADLIWSRIRGVANSALPFLERFERPADIFIDVALSTDWQHRAAHHNILVGVAELIRRLAEKEDLDSPELVAEAIFLAARVGSESAIPQIAKIVGHPDSSSRVDGREFLRSRALRALFGLLITYPLSKGPRVQGTFRNLR
jgi:HEAT repeat protein